MRHNVSLSLVALLFFFSFLSCGKSSSRENGEKAVLARVKDKVLTRSDLENIVPEGLSSKDSILFARNYIRQWVNDELLYEIADKNLPDIENIDQMVERYRKELIMFEYRKHLLNEKLSKQISDAEMESYYKENLDKFKLSSAIVKGLFLKVPENSPKISQLKKWYRSDKPDAVENIEKYGLHNAVIYEYFYNKWVSFDEVMNNIPYPVGQETEFLRTHENIELNQNGYWYFLNISDYLPKGGQMPFDFAKAQIKEILINQRKMQFIKDFEKELYEEALKNKEVEYFN